MNQGNHGARNSARLRRELIGICRRRRSSPAISGTDSLLVVPPTLVIFDCDGVLVDSEILVVEIEAGLLSDAGFTLTAQEIIEQYVGLSYPAMMEDLGTRFGRPVPEVLSAEVQRAALARLATDLQAVPGMDDLLAALKPARCVASSSDLDRITMSLAVSGLAHHFDPGAVFSAQMVERPKPAPDLFELAASRMGWSPADCLVIEDSPYGVAGASAAGMTVVGLVAGGHAGPGLADRLLAEGAADVFDSAGDLSSFLTNIND